MPWTPWALSSDEVARYRADVGESARGSSEPLWVSFDRLAGWFEGLLPYLGEFAVTGLLDGQLNLRWYQFQMFGAREQDQIFGKGHTIHLK